VISLLLYQSLFISCVVKEDNHYNWSEKAQKIVFRDSWFRHHISEDFVQLDSENNQILFFSRAVMNYNLHMGKVDENAQQREHYFFVKHRCRRYWWSLFLFHLEAAVLNVYILYKLSYSTSKMTCAQFQKKMTTSLMRNSAESIRKRFYDFNNSNSSISPSAQKHRWKYLSKKFYCTPCKAVKRFTSGAGKGVKRKTLSEVTDNDQPKKQRKRTVQTWFECTSEQCARLAACKTEACWETLHA